MSHAFPPRPQPAIAVAGGGPAYPVARIFCVGRNYAAHAREMGGAIDPEAPFFFTKSPAHLAPSGATIPYPPGTADFQHEVELVVALGAPLFRATPAAAAAAVWACAAGLDMTRRDLQAAARERRLPWDTGKDVEGSAVVGALGRGFVPEGQAITLTVNGARRQEGRLSDMARGVAELLAHLSGLYHLGPGDIVFTGTPAGVGPVLPGDVLEGRIDGLAPVRLTIGPPD
ncbi:MAG: fumarylacetoacetate hydrolase family protein [Rhodobacteraceae bacterium]|nr:fumarylacetoacetate hydrolase family protein [Paracoccaceae bacterium]